jgi:hypothetical protein
VTEEKQRPQDTKASIEEKKQELQELGAKLQAGGAEAEQAREQWISENLEIRTRSGAIERLKLNKAQKELYARWGSKNIVLKARQMGITTAIAARFFVDTIAIPGLLTVQVAQEQKAAEQIFRIVHRFWTRLGDGYRKGVLRPSHANVGQLVFPEIDSEYRVETAADENAGRGLTIQRLHLSEVALWPGDADLTLTALRAALPVNGGQFVLESTPSGAQGAFYSEWQKAEANGVVTHFFPWWYESSYTREGPIEDFDEEEMELMKKNDLEPKHIAFRRELRRDYGRLAQQEFAEDAETCFRASGECIFELEMLEKRMKQLESAPKPRKRENGRIRIYLAPEAGKKYIVGVDPAGGGIGGSYAAAQVIEKQTGLQCAELQGHWRPEELASRVAEIGSAYNQALLIVERNNHGMVVLEELLQRHKYPELFREQRKEDPGALTTVLSKREMLASMETQVRLCVDKLNSMELLRECKTMVRDAAGYARAASGSHDDLVMAYAIALRGL